MRHAYDATNDNWISGAVSPAASERARPAASNPAGRVAYSGMMPASGAAADLRIYSGWTRHTQFCVSRDNPSASSPQPVPASHRAAGDLVDEILDGLAVIAGMLALACVALFLLVLA